MSAHSYTPEDTARALERLRQWLKPGDVVHGIQRHRSRSGKSRSISFVVPFDGQLIELDPDICRALGQSFDQQHGGVRLDEGGGELINHLSRVLFPDGGALKFRRI